MNTLQLYLNGQLVDLSDDTPIALTYQINNLAEVKNQQGNTSNQFKLPVTQRNRRILGFPDEIAFTDDKPYLQYQAKVIQDGLEIIPYGIGELNGIDQDTAAITILSGNVDFFDAIDGKIYDMGDKNNVYGATLPFKEFDHEWSVHNVALSQTKTADWIWPVVDYGNLVFTPVGQNVINVRYMRPGFFIKNAIDLMLAATGYTGTGSLLSNPLYSKLIAQFSNDSFDHGTDYQNQPDVDSMSVRLDHDVPGYPDDILSAANYFRWPAILTNPAGHFKAGFVYDAPKDISVTATVTFPDFFLYGAVTDRPSSVEVSIIDSDLGAGTQTVLASKVFDFSGGYADEHHTGSGSSKYSDTKFANTVISVSTDMLANHQLAVSYIFDGKKPAYFIARAGATWEVKTNIKTVQYGQKVQCERIFPDISQKDLLKDTLQRFGVICQTDNVKRTVNFASLKDIVNNIPNANDWTTKCLNQGKSISFQLGGYAQVNNMRYKQDDNVTPSGFADAKINVDDKTLPAAADLFESQFSPTLNRPYIGSTTIAQIKMTDIEDEAHEFNINAAPRILVDNKIDLRSHTNASIRFTDGNSANDVVVNDIISAPYFYKPDGEYNLCFGDMPGTSGTLPGLKSLYYAELQKVLTQTKKVVRYFLLTPRDILELDLLIPVYLQQDGAYYYINKIDSWRKGQPTKVELVKLG
jgi:hypothetical protein